MIPAPVSKDAPEWLLAVRREDGTIPEGKVREMGFIVFTMSMFDALGIEGGYPCLQLVTRYWKMKAGHATPFVMGWRDDSGREFGVHRCDELGVIMVLPYTTVSDDDIFRWAAAYPFGPEGAGGNTKVVLRGRT